MKKVYVFLTIVLAIAFAASAFAGVGQGLSGPHYNLNIIGVPHDKEAPMDNNSGHRIFVPLQSGGDVPRQVKIKYVIGPDFKVLDANATDDNLAVIQVPYEYCEDYEAGCYDLLSFDVYAFGLGKPGGSAIVTAECEYTKTVVDPDGTLGLECEDTLLLGSFEVTRTKGKPKQVDITNIFRVTGCLDLGGEEGVCDTGDLEFRNLWIFNIEQLANYMWDYDNNGLKLMQIRFYETTSGYIGYKD
jgi:hypothetical protein